jgi:amidase
VVIDPAVPKTSLDFVGLAQSVAMLDAGEISSSELVENALSRIEAAQPRLSAFRVIRRDAARREATEADERRARGEKLPLLGVPVAIKDDTDLSGETTPFGSRGNLPVQTRDAEIVRRLRAAGAVITGKTTCSEFGQWPTGDTDAFGLTRNPWNLNYTPGGSSSGSAAAVAAGLVPAAVGSDGAGSVRIPAAWSGLVGLKPQRGRISSWPDSDAFNGLTTHGPLARSIDDLALLFDVLRGSHPGDTYRLSEPSRPFRVMARQAVGRLRIAVSTNLPFLAEADLDPEIRAATLRIAGVLAGLGHDVFAQDPDYGLIGLTFLPRGSCGVAEWSDRVPDAQFERATRFEVQMGHLLNGRPLRRARLSEAHYQAKVGRIFEQADVLLTPTTAQLPLPVGALKDQGWWNAGQIASKACPYCWAWNVLGWPGLNVPAGLSASGLPIGVQLLGHDSDEATLLALGAQLETVERWNDRHPGYSNA